MEEDIEIGNATEEEYPEEKHGDRLPIPENLPASDDEYWDPEKKGYIREVVSRDDLDRVKHETIRKMQSHTKLIQQGPFIICKTCPFEHTLNIDTSKFTLNIKGEIVPIDIT